MDGKGTHLTMSEHLSVIVVVVTCELRRMRSCLSGVTAEVPVSYGKFEGVYKLSFGNTKQLKIKFRFDLFSS